MTRDELSEILGVAKSSLNRWMSTGVIPRGRRVRIARTLDLFLSTLNANTITDRYGGVRTESTLYTAKEWADLERAAEAMHMTPEEFQKWAVTMVIEQSINARSFTEDHLPPFSPDAPA